MSQESLELEDITINAIVFKRRHYLASNGNGNYVGYPGFEYGWIFFVPLKIGLEESWWEFFHACTFDMFQRTSEGWETFALKSWLIFNIILNRKEKEDFMKNLS